MEELTTWWDALSAGLKFYYGIAFVSTAVMLVQTAASFFGGDIDAGDMDADLGGDGGADLQVLSLRTITAFLMGFGWAGAWFSELGWSVLLAVPLALVIGIVLMLAVISLMKLMYSLRQTGSVHFDTAIGELGTVYLPIPPEKEKAGKIEVMVQGRLMVVDAFTNAHDALENRARVRVIDVVGSNALLVEPEY